MGPGKPMEHGAGSSEKNDNPHQQNIAVG